MERDDQAEQVWVMGTEGSSLSNRQSAPYPVILADLVERIRFRTGWDFMLKNMTRDDGCHGLTLDIILTHEDSYHGNTRRTSFRFPVPGATFNKVSWQHWLWERIRDVSRHEDMEFFQFIEGEPDLFGNTEPAERPYAPNHGPGHDPYIVRVLATDEERRTDFRGNVKPAEEPS